MVLRVKPEFEAVILAGYGHGLGIIAEEIPKALLTVGNRPMIEYVLGWLEASGIQDIIVVGQPEHAKELTHYLTKVYESPHSNTRIDFMVCEGYGTVQTLKLISHRITSDVIIVPCDLFTDMPLSYLLQEYRLTNPTISCLFGDLPKIEAFGGVKEKFSSKLFLGLHDKQILYLKSEEDLPDSLLKLKTKILNSAGNMDLIGTALDKHVYIVKNWLLDWIGNSVSNTNSTNVNNDSVANSFREDLLPALIKCQFSRDRIRRLELDKFFPSIDFKSLPYATNEIIGYNAILDSLFFNKERFPMISNTAASLNSKNESSGSTGATGTNINTSTIKPKEGLLKSLIRGQSSNQKNLSATSFPDSINSSISTNTKVQRTQDLLHRMNSSLSTSAFNINNVLRINATLFNSKIPSLAALPDLPEANILSSEGSNSGNYCIRMNTLSAFVEVNKYMARISSIKIPASTEINAKAQIGNDSLFGESCVVGEKTSVKKSVIGAHCTIGKNVKMVNCVLLDYVKIEDNVKLEGCIISTGAIIQDKCNLKDCEVGKRYTVNPGMNYRNEKLFHSSH